MFGLTKKRRVDTWNEKAQALEGVMETRAEEFVDNIAHNREGISADREKFILDETTTPKVFHPNKNE